MIVKDGKSVSKALYHGIAKKSNFSAVKKMKGQLHHALPLYMGGSHEEHSLIQAEGMARVESAAHGMLHKMIDDQDITEHLGPRAAETTLEWKDLADHYEARNLAVLLGVLKDSGKITYEESDLSLVPKPTS